MTPSLHLQRFKLLAAELSAQPSTNDLADLALELAAAAAAAEFPGRSVAKLVEHNLRAADDSLRREIRQMAHAQLDLMTPKRSAIAIDPTWVPLTDAAVLLGLPRRYIVARLPDPNWRRAWGWPRWVGPGRNDWLFARAAVDGATAAATLAALPEHEPPYPLPEWCRRSPASEV